MSWRSMSWKKWVRNTRSSIKKKAKNTGISFRKNVKKAEKWLQHDNPVSKAVKNVEDTIHTIKGIASGEAQKGLENTANLAEGAYQQAGQKLQDALENTANKIRLNNPTKGKSNTGASLANSLANVIGGYGKVANKVVGGIGGRTARDIGNIGTKTLNTAQQTLKAGIKQVPLSNTLQQVGILPDTSSSGSGSGSGSGGGNSMGGTLFGNTETIKPELTPEAKEWLRKIGQQDVLQYTQPAATTLQDIFTQPPNLDYLTPISDALKRKVEEETNLQRDILNSQAMNLGMGASSPYQTQSRLLGERASKMLGEQLASLYGNALQNERQRQLQALQMYPSMFEPQYQQWSAISNILAGQQKPDIYQKPGALSNLMDVATTAAGLANAYSKLSDVLSFL